MADEHDRRQRSAAQPRCKHCPTTSGHSSAAMRAQLGCNPNTAQPQRGRSSAAATAHIIAGQTTSATKAQEATMEYATETPYAGNATACSRCIIFYTCSVATRIDADQGAQAPAHDWRACRASRRKRPRPLDRDQHKRAPALCAATELFNHKRARTAPRFKLRSCRGKPHRIFAAFGLGERFSSLD